MKFLFNFFFLMNLNFVHGSTSPWINCCMVLISRNIELAKMFIWDVMKTPNELFGQPNTFPALCYFKFKLCKMLIFLS